MTATLLLVFALGVLPTQDPAPNSDTAAKVTSAYRHDGPAVLNNTDKTPGATREGCTTAEICAADFRTGPVRDTIVNWDKLKLTVCDLYGLKPTECDARVEGDHLVSIELCGSPNSPSNVWPQPYKPEPGAKQKDVVENYLHVQVCAGKMPLATAVDWIRTDWYTVYLFTTGALKELPAQPPVPAASIVPLAKPVAAPAAPRALKPEDPVTTQTAPQKPRS